MKAVRSETNRHTQKYFSKLVTDKNFDKVEILDNYSLLVERDGFNCVHSLSAAEHLCLGYSFMAALRKSSGFLAPVIIDTPVAKIASSYRGNVAQWMRDALSIAQVILLVTDTEFTSEFKKEIKSLINQEYIIKHNDMKRISEVIKSG